MAATASQMISLGTKAPDFKLLNTVNGTKVNLHDLKSDKATVILFICNHCPFVHHICNSLSSLSKNYQQKGVNFIAISSNDIENYPEDSPELMTTFALENDLNFPYLYDADQSVAKAYKATCTPDIFVYNKDLELVYRGRFDQTRPHMGVATGNDLAKALDLFLETGQSIENQHPSIGCGIKWK